MTTAAEVQDKRVAQVERVLSSHGLHDVRVDVEEHSSAYVLVIGETREATARALTVLEAAGFLTLHGDTLVNAHEGDVFGVYFGRVDVEGTINSSAAADECGLRVAS